MKQLKADLHIHTADDPFDRIRYTSREIIERAAEEGFEVLAITNHLVNCYSEDLAKFASDRGILLIPGTEGAIKRKHVLILNMGRKAEEAQSLEELKRVREDGGLIIAPHPYFPSISSLRGEVEENLELFDALEYCSYYFRWMNFNKRAVRKAKSFGIPLIANSDSHVKWQFGRTYSYIEAEKSVDGVIDAVKKGRVKIVSTPLDGSPDAIRLALRVAGIPKRLLWKKRESW